MIRLREASFFNEENGIKECNGLRIYDLRYVDQFVLMFDTTSTGTALFGKKFNIQNKEQLVVVLEKLYYHAMITRLGEFIILDKSKKIEDFLIEKRYDETTELTTAKDFVHSEPERAVNTSSTDDRTASENINADKLRVDDTIGDSARLSSVQGESIRGSAHTTDTIRSERQSGERNNMESNQLYRRGREELYDSKRPEPRLNLNNFTLSLDTIQENSIPKNRLINNREAIKVLHDCLLNNRTPTEEEKIILSGYTGFGGLIAFSSQRDNDVVLEIRRYVHELEQVSKKEILKDLEATVLTAYYTPAEVIQGIYDIIGKAEIDRVGKVLEPSLGVGKFFGLMPDQLKHTKTLYGCDIDFISSNISKLLYPDAKIQTSPFEEAKYPMSFFDMTISNIPFGDIRVYDRTWRNKKNAIYQFAQQRIHNYFVVKAIENTKPNGLICLITSNNTLDAPGNAPVRNHISEEAEFLGAIRLPSSTFQGTQTEVVTDIIFLRKFGIGEIPKQKFNFTQVDERLLQHKNLDQEYNVVYNRYFHDNPDMMLGLPYAGGRYRGDSFALIGESNNLRERIASLAVRFDLNEVFTNSNKKDTKQVETLTTDIISDLRSGSIIIENNKVYTYSIQRNFETGELLAIKQEETKIPYYRAKAYCELRETLEQVLNLELKSTNEEELEEQRSNLNKQYAKFVQHFGELHDKANKYLVKVDINGSKVLGLERLENKKVVKSDIFYKRTINPNPIFNIESPQDAVLACLNLNGRVIPSVLQEYLGDDWRDECRGLIYPVPNQPGVYETKESYLCGNVREKLRIAESAAEFDDTFKDNVEALKAVQPQDIPESLIDIRLGARWVPVDVYKDFFCHLFDAPDAKIEIHYLPATDSFVLTLPYLTNLADFSTQRRSGKDILEASLEDRQIKIFDKLDDGQSVYNAKESQAANDKVEKIRRSFKSWIFAADNRKRLQSLSHLYNEQFNNIVLPKYSGAHLTLPGYAGPALRDHQKDAVFRNLQQQGGINDHIVGAGKTLVMIVSAMEMKRVGLANKPMIIALKSTVPQIAAEFRNAYPLANILAPDEKDFTKKNRTNLLGQIATNDWDCIILSHEQYCALEHNTDVERGLINEELNLLYSTVHSLDGEEQSELTRRQIKNLEKRIVNLETKLEKLLDRNYDPFTFENLGIDHLFVDESHYFKNLAYSTKHTDVAGLGDPSGSQKSRFLLMGVRALQALHKKDVGTTFLSGTPISNSLVELYLLLRYLTPSKLEEMGLNTFDAWASVFAERSSEVEFSVTGEIKFKDRFRKFTNVPELAKLYSSVADVRNNKNLSLPKPSLKVELVNSPLSSMQKEYMKEIINFAKTGQSATLGLTQDNHAKAKMLLATSLSAKVAMDIRLLNEDHEDEDTSKVSNCARRVANIYQESNEHRGVQLIFSDLGTPSEKFNVYDEIKRKLVDIYNIPEGEVVFIHDAKTDAQREQLFSKVQAGDIRVLLGSTQKMGTGVNVQNKICALHHLDVPWTPAAFEQRNGRGARQGNEYARLYLDNQVPTYVYAVEQSLDTYKYQLLEIKQNLIDQVKDGTIQERIVEENSDGSSLGFAEFVAVLSGNPLILEKANVDKEINKLLTSQRIFEEEKFQKKGRIEYLKITKEKVIRDFEKVSKDILAWEKNGYRKSEDGSSCYHLNINDVVFSKPKEAGVKILELVKSGNLGQIGMGFGSNLQLYTSQMEVYYQLVGQSGLLYGNKPLSRNEVNAGMCILYAIEQGYSLFQKLKNSHATIPDMEKELSKLENDITKIWPELPNLDKLIEKQRNIKASLEGIGDEQDNMEQHNVMQTVQKYSLLEFSKNINEIDVDGWDYAEENDISIPFGCESILELLSIKYQNLHIKEYGEKILLIKEAPEILGEIHLLLDSILERHNEFSTFEDVRLYANSHLNKRKDLQQLEKNISTEEYGNVIKSESKGGKSLYVLMLNFTVTRDEYAKLKSIVENNSGFWNKYHKGFIFKHEAEAQNALKWIAHKAENKELQVDSWIKKHELTKSRRI